MSSDEEKVHNVLTKAAIDEQKRKFYNKKNYENIKNKKNLILLILSIICTFNQMKIMVILMMI